MKRSPSTQAPPSARSLTRTMSSGDTWTSAFDLFVIPIGSDGWDSTGASSRSSTIIPRAKFPVKHIPITPMPGPPLTSWACWPSARSQSVTGAVRPAAKAANSFETHAGTIERNALTAVAGSPGTPNRLGSHTEHPTPTTRSANSTTFGVMPGISAMTTTAGPSPLRYTDRVVPPSVNCSWV